MQTITFKFNFYVRMDNCGQFNCQMNTFPNTQQQSYSYHQKEIKAIMPFTGLL